MTRRKHTTHGFTLVEMMVALTAGAIAMTSIYYVSAASSQHFHEQQMIANMQTALRLAMDRIRADLQRAAFLGSVNPGLADEGAGCGGTYGTAADGLIAQGLWIDNEEYTSVLPEAALNDVQADQVRLVGNYATADEYYAEFVSTSVLRLDIGRQSFRRSFGADPDAADYGAAFMDAFAIGRGVRVVGATGRVSLHLITDVTATDTDGPRITIAPDISTMGACHNLGDDVLVAPQVRLEYMVGTYNSGAGEKFAGSAALLGQNAPALLRRELLWPPNPADVNVTSGTVGTDAVDFSGNQQVVLEHVAHFDVRVFRDLRSDATDAITPGVNTDAAPDFFPGDGEATTDDTNNPLHSGSTNGTALAGPNGPHRIRSAFVELSVRAPSEDERFAFIARAAGAPLTRYDVDPAIPGAARVRTLRSEVFLPNFAYRQKLGD